MKMETKIFYRPQFFERLMHFDYLGFSLQYAVAGARHIPLLCFIRLCKSLFSYSYLGNIHTYSISSHSLHGVINLSVTCFISLSGLCVLYLWISLISVKLQIFHLFVRTCANYLTSICCVSTSPIQKSFMFAEI
jgi:hypothetical protein